MTNIGEKTTCSCKTCEHIVTEVCPHCEAEVEMRWNVAADGYKAFCPHCGKRLMLCDACQHPEDKCVENCDYSSETDTCRHNQPAQELKVGDVCAYGFGTQNASRWCHCHSPNDAATVLEDAKKFQAADEKN